MTLAIADDQNVGQGSLVIVRPSTRVSRIQYGCALAREDYLFPSPFNRWQMGLPGVRVPKSFYPRIQSALETCSASVEVHPVSEQDRQRGLLAAFVCTSVEGDVVQVRVHTAQSIAPDQMAAVLEPLKSGRFRYFRSNPFLGEIEASLIAHGALPIGQASSDITGKDHHE